jgi:hypothetical protein
MARAAKAAGYEVHVATRLKDGRAAIEKEDFVPHALLEPGRRRLGAFRPSQLRRLLAKAARIRTTR